MMDSPMIASLVCDSYTRRYTINPEWTGGPSVTVHAICSPNIEFKDQKDYHYMLDIYFSVDNYGVLDHIIGIPLGTGKKEKAELDREIDTWVEQTITEDENFPVFVQDYLNNQEILERAAEERYEAEEKEKMKDKPEEETNPQ